MEHLNKEMMVIWYVRESEFLAVLICEVSNISIQYNEGELGTVYQPVT